MSEFSDGFARVQPDPPTSRCPDCGEYGEQAGHMECPTPRDHP